MLCLLVFVKEKIYIGIGYCIVFVSIKKIGVFINIKEYVKNYKFKMRIYDDLKY